MDKDVTELFKAFSEDKHGDLSHLWGMNDLFQSEQDQKMFQKIFNPEQFEIIKLIVDRVVKAIEWHNKDDPEAHLTLNNSIRNLDAKLRNHRHELNKPFSSKAEF